MDRPNNCSSFAIARAISLIGQQGRCLFAQNQTSTRFWNSRSDTGLMTLCRLYEIALASTDHSAKTLAAHIAAMMNARLEAHLECIGDAMRDAVAANRT